jgi:hypothetical protein
MRVRQLGGVWAASAMRCFPDFKLPISWERPSIGDLAHAIDGDARVYWAAVKQGLWGRTRTRSFRPRPSLFQRLLLH